MASSSSGTSGTTFSSRNVAYAASMIPGSASATLSETYGVMIRSATCP